MSDSFSDLPDALVRDLLESSVPVADEVRYRFDKLQSLRSELRSTAQKKSLVRRKSDLEVTREPSVAAIDGSYQIHRLTSIDLCASAAVGVEGTSKEAQRHWNEPRHRFWANATPHNASTTLLLRGLMVSMELELASETPHDLVLLDGSFSSLVIYLNQGLSNIAEDPSMGDNLRQRWESQNLLQRLITVLESVSTLALPKYTSRNELGRHFPHEDTSNCDGRTLATLILEPGEYTSPLSIYRDESYHLPKHLCSSEDLEQLNAALSKIRVIYFRPFGWVPALRLELPGSIAHSRTRLSLVLRGLESQFFVPAVIEPYPLFLADRMVKSLGSAVAAMEQTITQHVTDSSEDLELTMLLMQNYRTESGRGGV